MLSLPVPLMAVRVIQSKENGDGGGFACPVIDQTLDDCLPE
jgi:hypothetical protein